MRKTGIIFLAALLGGIMALSLNYIFLAPWQSDVSPANNWSLNNPPANFTTSYTANLPTTLPDFTMVAENTVNTVVHIQTEYKRRTSLYDDFFGSDPFRDFFFGPRRSPQQERTITGSGSGVIINQNGYIITNNHVVDAADKIEVTLNDNRVFDAVIVGKDPTTDLALIKIDAERLPYAIFGNSDDVRVGEWVLAVGNPFNLTSTVTAGIVSAKGRNINILGGGTAIESFIQTDAALNRGNSGGALVNTNGKLIGINAAIASSTGSFAGYSFAIPSNIAKKVVEDLLEFGEIQRGFLGIHMTGLNSKRAEELSLDIFKGAYIERVESGGAADKAGLKQGDLIIGVDEVKIDNPSDLVETIGRKRPGDQVTLKYIRNGRERETKATLHNIHGEIAFIEPGERSIDEILGATFETVREEEKDRLGIKNGVQVSSLRAGKLRKAGIREGFIITRIDRKPVNSPQDIAKLLRNKENEGVLIEGIYPNGVRTYYAVGM